jgi:hypothetical protein
MIHYVSIPARDPQRVAEVPERTTLDLTDYEGQLA